MARWVPPRRRRTSCSSRWATRAKRIQAAGRIMNEATSGDGLLAMLLTNEEVANNLRALISNLRRHGVLFYRDSAAKVSPPPAKQPAAAPPHHSLGKDDSAADRQSSAGALRHLLRGGRFVHLQRSAGQRDSRVCSWAWFSGCSSCSSIGLLKGLSLRAFSSATLGLLLGLFFANLLLASEVLRYQSETTQWIGATHCLLRVWLPRHDARDAEQSR